MRLLYLVPEFPSQTHIFFWREVLSLRAMGVAVEIVSTRRPPVDACQHDFAPQAVTETHYLFPPRWVSDVISLLVRPRSLLNALRYIVNLPDSSWYQRAGVFVLILSAVRLTRLSRELKTDHIHVHSFSNAAHLAALAYEIGRHAYSLSLHGDLVVYGRDHTSKTKNASFVRCVTEVLRIQIVENTELPSYSVHCLSMGVDTDYFKPSPTVARLEGREFQLITVARLHPNKGHRFALRALRQIINEGFLVRYTIVGVGPAKKEIEDEVHVLGLHAFVTLSGNRSEAEVLRMFQSSDVMLLPSIGLGEAAPVAVMEAMSCGVPVVCSVIGGTPEMISDGVDSFLVDQEDVQAIAARLKLLICDEGLRRRIGTEARQRALRSFDSRKLAGRFKRLLLRHSSKEQLQHLALVLEEPERRDWVKNSVQSPKA